MAGAPQGEVPVGVNRGDLGAIQEVLVSEGVGVDACPQNPGSCRACGCGWTATLQNGGENAFCQPQPIVEAVNGEHFRQWPLGLLVPAPERACEIARPCAGHWHSIKLMITVSFMETFQLISPNLEQMQPSLLSFWEVETESMHISGCPLPLNLNPNACLHKLLCTYPVILAPALVCCEASSRLPSSSSAASELLTVCCTGPTSCSSSTMYRFARVVSSLAGWARCKGRPQLQGRRLPVSRRFQHFLS